MTPSLVRANAAAKKATLLFAGCCFPPPTVSSFAPAPAFLQPCCKLHRETHLGENRLFSWV